MTWDVHHQVWGRSAGLPARLGDALVCEGAARAAAEAGAAHRRVRGVEAELRALLDAASADLAPEPRRLARRIRRALARGRDVPAELELAGLERARWGELVAQRAQHRAALAAAVVVCRAESARARETERSALRRLIGEPRVAEAAAHSSRSLAAGFARALAAGAPAAGPASLIERRMLLFLQRLTAKPAMMAAAGPCFWATLDGDAAPALRAAPGEALVRARRASFEHWAALALARRMQADPDLAPHCVVRLNPSCLLDGTTLFYPIAHRLRLEPREAQVLRWCTEGHTLGALRRTIAAHPAEERAEYEKLLDTHLKSGVATAEIPVPAAAAPEAALLAFLERLPDDCAGKPRWQGRLGRLTALKGELERTAGPARRAAEQRLDALFRETADAPATRNPGQLHGARFVTYEDCARDIEVSLGGPLARDLDALAPVLDLASWIARTCAERYEQRLRPAHARLARNLNSVDYITFVRETQWITDTPEVVAEIRRELQRAWEAELGDRLAAATAGADAGPLALTPDDVRGVLARLDPDAAAADAADAADAAPWLPAADCHGLNVLAAATSADAFAGGHYELFLHKLYKGVPLWLHPAVLPFCPDPGAALAAFDAWCRAPILQLVDSAASYHRSNLNLPIVENLWEAEIPNAASRAPAERTIPCAQLEVIQERGRLVVCSHDRRIQAGLFAVRWSFLQHKLLGISVHPEAAAEAATGAPSHHPRVALGRWILSRAQWRFPAAPLLRRWDRASPAAAIAAWQAEHGLPDHVFVKVPGQQKSIAIDLRSALQGDLLRALAAQSAELLVTEMAPAPGATWLADRAGATYVSELRFTALRRPAPPAEHRRSR